MDSFDEDVILSRYTVLLMFYTSAGCPPPPLTIKSQKQKQRYIAGDELRDRNVICPEGLSLSSESITCLSNGQWSDTVSCVKGI